MIGDRFVVEVYFLGILNIFVTIILYIKQLQLFELIPFGNKLFIYRNQLRKSHYISKSSMK